MKLEIAESLVSSWLKHVHHCTITELNWKISSSWSIEPDEKVVSALVELNHEFGEELFKKSSSINQILKQTEIDVVGFSFQKNKVFLAEVAFHEKGLNYGSTQKTILNIVKKLVRAAFIWYLHFRNDKYEAPFIGFISPKTNPVLESENLYESLNKASQILSKYLDSEFVLDFITNERFESEVFKPLTTKSRSISDSNELFLRAYQLIELMEKRNSKQTKVQGITKDVKAEDSSLVEKEILRVKKKVPIWLQKKHQINSRILIAFLRLRKINPVVQLYDLEQAAKVDNFMSNFSQMAIIAEKNHAKVFDQKAELVQLWEPVADFILKSANELGFD